VFLTIEGTEVYQHHEAPARLLKDIRSARRAAKAVSSALFWVSFGLALSLLIRFFIIDPELMAGQFVTFTLPTIVVWIVLFATSRVLKHRYERAQRERASVLGGGYRQYFVSAKHYSYELMFTPAMRLVMARGEDFVKEAIDRLLSSKMAADLDYTARLEQRKPQAISGRLDAKLELIKMVERLSEGLGLSQPTFFEEERADAKAAFEREMGVAALKARQKTELIEELTAQR
jgi:hypothetical protein